ncbi:hypothetical protein GCM10010525_30550 [Glutamicibacter bergerei]
MFQLICLNFPESDMPYCRWHEFAESLPGNTSGGDIRIKSEALLIRTSDW